VYADEFAVERNTWDTGTRPCAFSFALGDVAFADFGLDDDGCLHILRISFDGYGCCNVDQAEAAPMSLADSTELIAKFGSGKPLGTGQTRSLMRRYFEAHRQVIWEDALIEYGLVSAANAS